MCKAWLTKKELKTCKCEDGKSLQTLLNQGYGFTVINGKLKKYKIWFGKEKGTDPVYSIVLCKSHYLYLSSTKKAAIKLAINRIKESMGYYDASIKHLISLENLL